MVCHLFEIDRLHRFLFSADVGFVIIFGFRIVIFRQGFCGAQKVPVKLCVTIAVDRIASHPDKVINKSIALVK